MGLCLRLGESSVDWGTLWLWWVPCPQGCHSWGDAVPVGVAVPIWMLCLWDCHGHGGAMLIWMSCPWGGCAQ